MSATRSDSTSRLEVEIREPATIHRASGEISNGTFRGRWNFAFDDYVDPEHEHFGNLRVLNDDTLSPGAVWPLHPHRQNEVVTYVAEGEFRHEDERGKGGVLHAGGVQHTTVGRGMYHSEINNRPDAPMRFIQIWFYPERLNLEPSVEQREIDRSERTDRWLAVCSSRHPGALPLRADAAVLASYARSGRSVVHRVEPGRGAYLYVIGGGPVRLDDRAVPTYGAAAVRGEGELTVRSENDAELLLLDVNLGKGWPTR
jgi:redox-sensitive bicupin YhaK (pirin superfamily)